MPKWRWMWGVCVRVGASQAASKKFSDGDREAAAAAAATGSLFPYPGTRPPPEDVFKSRNPTIIAAVERLDAEVGLLCDASVSLVARMSVCLQGDASPHRVSDTWTTVFAGGFVFAATTLTCAHPSPTPFIFAGAPTDDAA